MQESGEKKQALSRYQQIYAVVDRIPFGQVATYGQIAGFVPGCTARMVGYAMAALPADTKVPWHRVVNHQGKISARKNGVGDIVQRKLLMLEGIEFDWHRRLDFGRYLWRGP